ncbi:MAG: bifunctional riboflavin kinase/FAD synthetase [Nitrospiraceae bacterium]|nr:bifunctional riboflavin kinase/FAD synthetase [Nitrospiraceae bacterium]
MSGIDIIKGLPALKKPFPKTVLTIGNFDGVHIGHQKIMREVARKAGQLGGTPMAMSFDPHPVKVFSPESPLRLLTPVEEKARLMAAQGIKKLLLVNFNREFARLEPEDFVRRVLVEKISPVHVIVGHNYTFGRAKKGDTKLLRKLGRKYGFGLHVVRHAMAKGQVVSSSRIRALLERGRVSEAAGMLGRAYMIEGTVEMGAGRGASLLGFPTANIRTPHELIPREGVYVVKALVKGKLRDAVLNIGRNPTFGGNALACEVHIMDFKADLLGSQLSVYFVERLRSEETFASVQALKEAIGKDIEAARRILALRKTVIV